jgi:lipopolysaccharide transport system permease protein
MICARELWDYREVAMQLAWREIRVRFKQSFLGFAWAIIQPVSLMVLFTIIFTRFMKVPSENYPYPVFIYSVLLPWGLFSSGLIRATSSIVANASLIQKIYIPREIFIVVSLAPPVTDFLLSGVIYVGLMAWFHVAPTWQMLWVFPLLIAEILLILGIGIWLATFNAFYRDASSALGLLLQLWFYATPIFYPLASVPERFMPYYRLNPAVGIMDGFRNVLLKGMPPDPALMAISFAWIVFLLLGGLLLFRRAEGYFADVL